MRHWISWPFRKLDDRFPGVLWAEIAIIVIVVLALIGTAMGRGGPEDRCEDLHGDEYAVCVDEWEELYRQRPDR